MTRAYQHDLDRLADQLRSLGTLVDEALRKSLRALRKADPIEAREVIRADEHVNALLRDIEEGALRFLARQSPVAHDLRLLLTTISVAGELERGGDYAKAIAKNALRLATAATPLALPPALIELGDLATRLLTEAVAAYLAGDASTARAVAAQDDEADRIEEQLDILLRAAIHEDMTRLDAALALMQTAATLERLADRATNIAERVVYLATAASEELNP
jgi:phosphate transport system protein